MPLDVEFSKETPKGIKSFIDQGFREHTYEVTKDGHENFCFFIQDKEKYIAALTGYFFRTDFYIKTLMVDKNNRGKGLASELMKEAEQLASNKECQVMWVDTLEFQASDFYKKCGYEEHGRITDYREQHDRIFFRKALK